MSCVYPKDIYLKGVKLEGWDTANQDPNTGLLEVTFKDGRFELYSYCDVEFTDLCEFGKDAYYSNLKLKASDKAGNYNEKMNPIAPLLIFAAGVLFGYSSCFYGW